MIKTFTNLSIVFILIMLLLSPVSAISQSKGDKKADSVDIVTFQFIPGDDMFYDVWRGNDREIKRLSVVIDKYFTDIISGGIPIYIDSYTASMKDIRRNRNLSYIRANRIKSELILKKGLREDNFITTNNVSAYEGQKDVVVVSVMVPVIPEIEILKPEPTVCPPPVLVEQEPVVLPDEEEQKFGGQTMGVHPCMGMNPYVMQYRFYRGWYAGANIGMPFFWGDFVSTASDKTYIGLSAGIYGGYQFNSWLGVSLSLDYAYNKTGHRGYASDYLLDPSGMTYYVPQSGTTMSYEELYGKINMFSVGLHADLNANRIFGRRAARFPLKLIVSPAVYANTFSSNIYTKSDDKKYVDKDQSQSVSLGLGGDVMLRYDINTAFGVHLKGTGMWITDNEFDNIRTVGKVKQNAMWGVSAGMVWRVNAR